MAHHRRLAVVCSHLRQAHPRHVAPIRSVSTAHCHGDGGDSGGVCVFCRIVRGESPAYKLYEDDVCMCILDSSPLSRGHSLLIPKAHYSSLGVTPLPIIATMFSRVPFLSRAIMKATQCDSFNLLVNNGAAAGQVVFHTHLHLIPRRGDDKLWTSERNFKRKPLNLNQDTDSLAHRIREQVSITPNGGNQCESQESKLGENS